MPCDSYARTVEQDRKREEAVDELEKAIAAGKVMVTRNVRGEPTIINWSATKAAKAGWQEGCALHFLAAHGGWLTKQKLAKVGATKESLAKLGYSHH